MTRPRGVHRIAEDGTVGCRGLFRSGVSTWKAWTSTETLRAPGRGVLGSPGQGSPCPGWGRRRGVAPGTSAAPPLGTPRPAPRIAPRPPPRSPPRRPGRSVRPVSAGFLRRDTARPRGRRQVRRDRPRTTRPGVPGPAEPAAGMAPARGCGAAPRCHTPGGGRQERPSPQTSGEPAGRRME